MSGSSTNISTNSSEGFGSKFYEKIRLGIDRKEEWIVCRVLEKRAVETPATRRRFSGCPLCARGRRYGRRAGVTLPTLSSALRYHSRGGERDAARRAICRRNGEKRLFNGTLEPAVPRPYIAIHGGTYVYDYWDANIDPHFR